jgi:hypothetical protein
MDVQLRTGYATFLLTLPRLLPMSVAIRRVWG